VGLPEHRVPQDKAVEQTAEVVFRAAIGSGVHEEKKQT
jgi:hypothetical protein